MPFTRQVGKYGTARYATDDSIIRGMRIACALFYGHLRLQTQIQNKNNAFPWQKWLHESVIVTFIRTLPLLFDLVSANKFLLNFHEIR